MIKNLALYSPSSSFPQGSDGGFLVPYKRLEVTGGYTLLDDADYDYHSKWKWFQHPSGYITRASNKNGLGKMIYLHREILKPIKGKETDHINRNRFDNRRSNLRHVSASQNAHNRKIRSDNTTGHMGIWFRNDTKKWTARIVVEGKRKVLGCFIDKGNAISAYKKEKEDYVRANY